MKAHGGLIGRVQDHWGFGVAEGLWGKWGFCRRLRGFRSCRASRDVVRRVRQAAVGSRVSDPKPYTRV